MKFGLLTPFATLLLVISLGCGNKKHVVVSKVEEVLLRSYSLEWYDARNVRTGKGVEWL